MVVESILFAMPHGDAVGMTYYADFTVCDYFPSGEWLCRLIAVGWIEHGRPFPQGEVRSDLTTKIRNLREEFGRWRPDLAVRGQHVCSICRASHGEPAPLDGSDINLFIPHPGFVFVAPGRVDHYIDHHGYLPPESFIDAVLACPSPSTDAYRDRLSASNRGVEAPFFRGPDHRSFGVHPSESR